MVMMVKLLEVVGLVYMNKHDFKLIIVILLSSLFIILSVYLLEPKGDKQALVYRSNELVLTIDLSTDSYAEYNVDGKNGNILIIRSNGKVKVSEENSPRHLCSKQGWISNSYESIVCLPNEVVIKIEAKNALDAVL